MIKLFFAMLLFICCGILNAQVVNGDNNVKSGNESSKDGQNKFAIFGNAEMTFLSDKNSTAFGEVNFKPIFLWRISDNLFVEAEPEFETGEGTLDIGLEYANMCYFVNRNLILYAGRFLPKFGAYRGRMGEAFINRFPTNPVGFGDGGIGAMNEVGVGAQGAFGAGDTKFNYNFYLSNGPILLTDDELAGQFEYEGYIGNNKGKAIGGRIGFLPISNSSLEIGYSFQSKKKTGDPGTDYENVGVNMQAVDLNYYNHITPLKSDIRLIAEWKYQKVDNAIYYHGLNAYTFKNNPSAYYIAGTIRPVHVDNEFVHNLELAARYSEFKRPTLAPWGGDNTHQVAVSLDYWLKWNCLVKLTYQTQKDEIKTFFAQAVFGF
ncbi:MAG: hypothetical protein EPN92_01205 [Chitinophagaceae bacterium]|nr:MAG: hypothetical protein EPN92_01205 [Chitinophagaceae bacterium]